VFAAQCVDLDRCRQRNTNDDDGVRRDVGRTSVVRTIAGNLRTFGRRIRRTVTMMPVFLGRCRGVMLHHAIRSSVARMSVLVTPADAKSTGRERAHVDAHCRQRYRYQMPAEYVHGTACRS